MEVRTQQSTAPRFARVPPICMSSEAQSRLCMHAQVFAHCLSGQRSSVGAQCSKCTCTTVVCAHGSGYATHLFGGPTKAFASVSTSSAKPPTSASTASMSPLYSCDQAHARTHASSYEWRYSAGYRSKRALSADCWVPTGQCTNSNSLQGHSACAYVT